MSKLIVVVGATGNQGGSVVQRFLQDPSYRVRGLTRNTSSPAAQALAAQGVELATVDLDDSASLVTAFAGANLIFSVTNYWEPFHRPDCRERAAAQNVSCRRFAYDVESAQGRNIADAAAATVDSLDDNGFIVSTLSHARKCSRGRFTELYHFDSKAEVFPDYVRERHPWLAAKMSCVQTGYFMTSFRLARDAYFTKSDGTYLMRFPMSPDKPVPHLDVTTDTGSFVHAVTRMPPGKSYMCAGTVCSWSEYAATFTKVAGVECRFRQITFEEMVSTFPKDRDTGVEIAEMFVYSDDPGYDGGEKLAGPKELREAGFECPMTSLEDFMRKQDWSEVLKQKAA